MTGIGTLELFNLSRNASANGHMIIYFFARNIDCLLYGQGLNGQEYIVFAVDYAGFSLLRLVTVLRSEGMHVEMADVLQKYGLYSDVIAPS